LNGLTFGEELERDLDSFEEDLDKGIDELFDTCLMIFVFLAILSGLLVIISKTREKVKENKEKKKQERRHNPETIPTQRNELPQISPRISHENSQQGYPDPNWKGQWAEDGYEWLELPVQSGTWYWRDQQTGQWEPNEKQTFERGPLSTSLRGNIDLGKSIQNNMAFCSRCGKEVQADWVSCPHCSNSLSQTAALPRGEVEQKLKLVLVKKGGLITRKLTVRFTDPLRGVHEMISFSTMSRTYKVKLSNGTVIGKLPLKGMTITSGAEGMISLPSGHSYNAVLMTGLMGPTGLTITDWDDGRKCMISF
jgi:hypothetical protein